MTQDLLNGFEDFAHYQYENGTALMPKLVEDGQAPKYFIISCIDSRANPGTIFRARPGTFFAHKAMGALVRPYKQGTALAASLQFALTYNNVPNIIVLGHTQCGAIEALANNLEDNEITGFISMAKASLKKAQACCSDHDEILAMTEKETILQSAENLKTYPSVQRALAENRLNIKAWLFDMKEGQLLEYNIQTKDFRIISASHKTEDSRKEESHG
ncbi:MAG: hypothetical protein H6861_00580 [Rhodospirillales bacterium]|nr:hypothetical protein [Rhodospirillales bacterium]